MVRINRTFAGLASLALIMTMAAESVAAAQTHDSARGGWVTGRSGGGNNGGGDRSRAVWSGGGSAQPSRDTSAPQMRSERPRSDWSASSGEARRPDRDGQPARWTAGSRPDGDGRPGYRPDGGDRSRPVYDRDNRRDNAPRYTADRDNRRDDRSTWQRGSDRPIWRQDGRSSDRPLWRDNDRRGDYRGGDRDRGGDRYRDRRPVPDYAWNRGWRNERRYDWRDYRSRYRSIYRAPRYYAPYNWNYGYRRFSIGFVLWDGLFSDRYWISDPYYYRLPPAYGSLRWVRYYNDALLVDVGNGYVVDAIYDFFW